MEGYREGDRSAQTISSLFYGGKDWSFDMSLFAKPKVKKEHDESIIKFKCIYCNTESVFMGEWLNVRQAKAQGWNHHKKDGQIFEGFSLSKDSRVRAICPKCNRKRFNGILSDKYKAHCLKMHDESPNKIDKKHWLLLYCAWENIYLCMNQHDELQKLTKENYQTFSVNEMDFRNLFKSTFPNVIYHYFDYLKYTEEVKKIIGKLL
jgi:hypothetical protein